MFKDGEIKESITKRTKNRWKIEKVIEADEAKVKQKQRRGRKWKKEWKKSRYRKLYHEK